jgi:hypothetical protein
MLNIRRITLMCILIPCPLAGYVTCNELRSQVANTHGSDKVIRRSTMLYDLHYCNSGDNRCYKEED